jgi:hypothetical protein
MCARVHTVWITSVTDCAFLTIVPAETWKATAYTSTENDPHRISISSTAYSDKGAIVITEGVARVSRCASVTIESLVALVAQFALLSCPATVTHTSAVAVLSGDSLCSVHATHTNAGAGVFADGIPSETIATIFALVTGIASLTIGAPLTGPARQTSTDTIRGYPANFRCSTTATARDVRTAIFTERVVIKSWRTTITAISRES